MADEVLKFNVRTPTVNHVVNGVNSAVNSAMNVYRMKQQMAAQQAQAEGMRQLRSLQMQKIQSEMSGSVADLSKVYVASKLMENGSSATLDPIVKTHLEKTIGQTIDNVNSPEQARYVADALSKMNLNKTEEGLLAKQYGAQMSFNTGVARNQTNLDIANIKSMTDVQVSQALNETKEKIATLEQALKERKNIRDNSTKKEISKGNNQTAVTVGSGHDKARVASASISANAKTAGKSLDPELNTIEKNIQNITSQKAKLFQLNGITGSSPIPALIKPSVDALDNQMNYWTQKREERKSAIEKSGQKAPAPNPVATQQGGSAFFPTPDGKAPARSYKPAHTIDDLKSGQVGDVFQFSGTIGGKPFNGLLKKSGDDQFDPVTQ